MHAAYGACLRDADAVFQRKECEGRTIRKLSAWPTEGGCQLPIDVSASSRGCMYATPLLASRECLLAHRNEYYAAGIMLEVRPRYLAALVLEELCALAVGGR